MRKVVASVVGVVAGAALVLQGLVGSADAGVANPGSVTFMIDTLSIGVGSTTGTYDASTSTGPAAKLVGTINSNGAISIPTSGATFPVFRVQNSAAGGDGYVTVTPRLAATATGSLNPDTGVVAIRLKLIVDLDAANLPSSCAIGTTSAPVDLTALATTTSGGAAYSQSTGALTLVDRTYSVPTSSGCSIAGGSINNALGLPSPSGSNVATFAMRSTPILAPGTTTTSTTGPSTTAGPTSSTTVKTTTSTTSRPPFSWPFRTTTTVRTTSTTARPTTTTTRPTTTTVGGPVTTTTTRPWWCYWC